MSILQEGPQNGFREVRMIREEEAPLDISGSSEKDLRSTFRW